MKQTLFLVSYPAIPVTPVEIAALVGGALGIYNRLRMAAGLPDMPAEVAAAFATRGKLRFSNHGQLGGVLGGTLPTAGATPRRTVANAADFSQVMEQIVQDMLDAANDRSPRGPRYVYQSESSNFTATTIVAP